MANQSFRGREEIIEADTETNLLDDFVCIFGVEVVVNGINGILSEILRRDLNQICYLCLFRQSDSPPPLKNRGCTAGLLTRINIMAVSLV